MSLTTPLAIGSGGTGQSTQQTAINALTAVAGATNEHVLTKDTATGNAIFKAASSLPVVDETAIVFKTGTPANTLTLNVDAFTAARVWTFPDAASTFAGLSVAQTFTAANIFTGTISSTGSGTNSERFGAGATCIGNTSVAIGQGASAGVIATDDDSVAIGQSSSTTGSNACAIGQGATATTNGLAIGANVSAGNATIAIGSSASVQSGSTGLGFSVGGAGTDGVCIGYSADINGVRSVSIGRNAQTNADSISIGYGATAVFPNIQCITLGTNAVATKPNQMTLGSSSFPINEMVFPGGKARIDQFSTTGGVPVLELDQADIDIEFIKFIGSSEDGVADRSLVDAADMTTPGALVGWLQVYIQDEQATNPITDGVYYVPFYAAPSA
jgi:hypothetical protein